MLRKRRNPTPHFRMPVPFQPISGQHAPLRTYGLFPHVALMQVAAADTLQKYCLCRGFDTRIGKFIDYAEGDADKPGIPVAKPYESRVIGLYTVGQIYVAALPIQSANGVENALGNVYRVPPSPTGADIRLGQNPGNSSCHPANLAEAVEPLQTAGGVYINWMFLSPPGLRLWRATLNEDMVSNDAAANLLKMDGTDTGVDVTVEDPLGIFDDLANGDACLVLQQDCEYFVIQAPCP